MARSRWLDFLTASLYPTALKGGDAPGENPVVSTAPLAPGFPVAATEPDPLDRPRPLASAPLPQGMPPSSQDVIELQTSAATVPATSGDGGTSVPALATTSLPVSPAVLQAEPPIASHGDQGQTESQARPEGFIAPPTLTGHVAATPGTAPSATLPATGPDQRSSGHASSPEIQPSSGVGDGLSSQGQTAATLPASKPEFDALSAPPRLAPTVADVAQTEPLAFSSAPQRSLIQTPEAPSPTAPTPAAQSTGSYSAANAGANAAQAPALVPISLPQSPKLPTPEAQSLAASTPASQSTGLPSAAASSGLNAAQAAAVVTPKAIASDTVSYGGSNITFSNFYASNVSAAYHNCVIEAEQSIIANLTCSQSITINESFNFGNAGAGNLASNTTQNYVEVDYN